MSVKWRYQGIDFDIERYKAMLKRQRFKCAICRKRRPGGKGKWSVDHDHVNGKVRGLLCNWCNLMLGHAKDNQRTLKRAITYLKDHQ